MTSLELTGCPYQPLGAYLKALSVLRLVSEQEDREARGRWTNECFVLESTLDRDGLLNFFLSKYSPTPVVAPWNGGSGFYPKDRKVGVNAIEASGESRFDLYREAISIVRRILARVGGEKVAPKATRIVGANRSSGFAATSCPIAQWIGSTRPSLSPRTVRAPSRRYSERAETKEGWTIPTISWRICRLS
jgi:CRISPR-associated protein Csx17